MSFGYFIEPASLTLPNVAKEATSLYTNKDEAGKTHLVVVPKRKTLPKGTLLAIPDQAGLTRAEFMEQL